MCDVAQDHAILARLCGSSCAILAIEAAEAAVEDGLPRRLILPGPQAVFAKPCGSSRVIFTTAVVAMLSSESRPR